MNHSTAFHIAVLPGDGIGPEVTAAAFDVLEALESRLSGVSFLCRQYQVGAAEYQRRGDPFPAAILDSCKAAHAVFLGAMGLPGVRWPDGREIAPQLDLREQLDLYAGMRPVKLYHEHDTPLKNRVAGEIDLLLVRESTEGLFSSRLAPRDAKADQATDTLLVTRKGAERVCRAAFEAARSRRKQVALVDKANVLPSMVFFREVFQEVSREFPDIQAEAVYVDAAALYLVRDPGRFDVIVTENMFGDILSDLTAGLVGGMGMAPSADIGDRWAVFQPAHGSAPDIAGRGVANPIAAILSLAMLLEWLNTPETIRGAGMVRQAVEEVLANPAHRTPDLGGSLGTRELTALVVARLGRED